MAIERRLTEIAGPVGGQAAHGALAQRPGRRPTWRCTRASAPPRRSARSRALMAVLLARAEEHLDWPMPGYTHLQRAQPVYLGHHLLAYFWMLARDRARFAFAEREAGRLPLGAGALAGVNFDTDRALLARELGFDEVAPNSIDAVSGRDFVLDYLGRGRDLRDAPLAPGRRARAVVERGVRLLRAARRVELGLLDHAAEEEPRRRRAAAREGAARGRPPRRLHGVHARAAADLQQGPAGGQGAPVRRGRHARADARRGRAG